MKFFIKTFGCRVNFAETDELKEKLEIPASAGMTEGNAGMTWVCAKSEKNADVVVVRACSVTRGAEQGVRQAIRKYKRAKKTVYVLGCFREKIKEADGYFKSDSALIKHIAKKTGSRISASRSLPRTRCGVRDDRERAFVKIQDGCDFECSFCVTRLLRGKSKFISQNKILRQIAKKESQGYKEIILTGINILLIPDIHKLIKSILKQSTVARIRFGSIDPRLLTDNFINLFRNPRLMPHLHLSIQSGSERVLRDMKRPIKITKIKNITQKLRAINPLFNISADIIVGYPTETEVDFKKTCKLAESLQLSKIHYFPYSTRPKTPAENLKPLKSKTIKKRLTEIKKLDKKLSLHARKKIIGKKIPVLFEHGKNNIYHGYTPNFLRIKKSSKNNLTGKIKDTIINLNNFDN